MIHPFNRKELLTTFDIETLSRARSALAAAGIDHSVKVVDRSLASPLPGSRSRGAAGQLAAQKESLLYVKKSDWEAACHAVGRRP